MYYNVSAHFLISHSTRGGSVPEWVIFFKYADVYGYLYVYACVIYDTSMHYTHTHTPDIHMHTWEPVN